VHAGGEVDTVLVVDYGAQYAQLIARRVRECHVYSEIVPSTMPAAEMLARGPKAIILSGGPSSVYAEGAPPAPPGLFGAGVPVLGICYGLQILNVYRCGSLRQHIESRIDHTAREQKHAVQVDPLSRLGQILRAAEALPTGGTGMEVNTSHHQAAATVGDGLRVAAKAPDGVIEALEGSSAEHFVLAVQWHPERSPEEPASQAIFRALVEAARARHQQLAGEFESLPK